MSKVSKFEKLCEEVLAISPTIRFAGVINNMGTLVAGGMKQGINSMEDKEDSSKLYIESALRSEMRKDFDAEFGKTIYSFSERERIKVASFPLQDNHLLRVSLEKHETHHDKIIKNILKIISNLQGYGQSSS
jgi:hypothetical protein